MRRILSWVGVGIGLAAWGCDAGVPASTGHRDFGQLALDGDGQIGRATDTGSPTSPPQHWSQYQGGSAHVGATLTETVNALTDNLKWEVDVGQVAYSSPVIGPDGTVYVVNSNGELVAVSRNGVERWRIQFYEDDQTTTPFTPAVAGSGDIYVVTTTQVGFVDDGEWTSTLECVSPDGVRKWTASTGDDTRGYTGPPTVYGEHVFILARTPRTELLVYDRNGRLVAAAPRSYLDPLCADGYGLLDLLGDLREAFLPPFDFDSSVTLAPEVPMPERSVAVARVPERSPDGWPVVVFVERLGISVYEFRLNDLNRIGGGILYDFDCGDDPPPYYGTPTITPDGRLLLGDWDGKIRSFDLATGELTWEAEVDGPVVHPPAAVGDHTYVSAKGLVYRFDSNGELRSIRGLASSGSSAPVISANHVYVATEVGLQTYDLDLDGDHTLDSSAAGFWVSPAVGEDGTLYAVTEDGWLRAYGGQAVPPFIHEPPSGFGLEDPGRGGVNEPSGPGRAGLSLLGQGSTVPSSLQHTTDGG